MRRISYMTVIGLALCTGSVHAQGFVQGGPNNPANRPAFSPYLNLLRNDAPLVNNYFGLVRPEINFRNSLQQLDTQQTLNANQQAAFENTLALPATGHASRFLTHGRYFQNNQAGIGQFGAQPGAAAAAPGAQAPTPATGGRR